MQPLITKMSRLFPGTLRDMRDGLMDSQSLLEQAGFIRSSGAAGIYTLLPLGWRVHGRICDIVFEEMEQSGVQNLTLPILHQRELWEATGRWRRYVDTKTMFVTTERHTGAEFGLSPTAEEVVTKLAAESLRSWRDMPLILHQIGPKFRDEIRPRLGLLRCREFVMSDAYSFDRDEDGMRQSYNLLREIYRRVFGRVGLSNCIAVQADSGAIGGQGSAEFMAVASAGEDVLLTCDHCDYGANVDKAQSRILGPAYDTELREAHVEPTPNVMTVEQLQVFFPEITADLMVKTIIFTVNPDSDRPYEVAVCIRGDREINVVKLTNILHAESVVPAAPSVVEEITGARVGFAGPIGLTKVSRILFDRSVESMTNFLCGCNRSDFHVLDVNLGREFPMPEEWSDLHVAKGGDICLSCGTGTLKESRGIEVGHVFMLQSGYAQKLGVTYLDEHGLSHVPWMGCYGIGTTRLLQAIAEQNYDDHGLIWPASVAPYQVFVLAVNNADQDALNLLEPIATRLRALGLDVLLDDRTVSAGVKFKDADLVGCPFRVTIGRRAKDGFIEARNRRTGNMVELKVDDLERYFRGEFAIQ